MFRPRVIPVLLMSNRVLIKTIKFSNPTYIGDPINAVRIFNAMESDELILLDITATKEKRIPNPEIIRGIADEANMPFAIGGGICTFEDAHKMIQGGAEKVIFNTAFFTSPNVITKTVATFGSQSVIVSLDIKKNLLGKKKVYFKNGSLSTGMTAVDAARKAQESGAGEIMIQSIEHDGAMHGYDLDLISEVSQTVSIPVIACSGAGNLRDFKKAIDNGASAAAAGSMFVYQSAGKGVLINYPEKKELQQLFLSEMPT